MPKSIDEIAKHLRSATTQKELTNRIRAVELSADEWRALSQEVTGRKARTGRFAKDNVHQHFSDNLLLKERVQQVTNHFEKTRRRGR